MLRIDQLYVQNPHWNTGLWPKAPTYRRHLFVKLWNHVEQMKLMIYLIGARRTGKSVLLRQIVENLLDRKITSPKQILWWEFSADSTTKDIEDVFENYYREIVDPEQAAYVFFDEVQYADGYEVVIKQLYDLYEGRIKFFLTGSLSLSYKRRMQESMLGRFLPYRLFPLSFEEYLELLNDSVKLSQYKRIKSEENVAIKKHMASTMSNSFREFLAWGRFPETVGRSQDSAGLYLDTTASLALGQDAFSYFNIHRPGELTNLYEYFKVNSGGIISISSLAKNASAETISNYLDILELMGLVYFVYNSTNPIAKNNVARKAYVNSAFYLRATKHNLSTSFGFATESYILERLLERGQEVTFWHNRRQEIDFLLPREKMAFEVKFRSQLGDPKVLKIFAQKNNFQSTVITLDTWETKEGIKYLPACLF